MKFLKPILLFNLLCMISSCMAQENAAPSIHLYYFFPSADAILKMQKVKIVQSVNTSYFEINSFTLGYAGLQQTPDKSFGNPNILISSLWDPNTNGGIRSSVDYNHSTTFKSRFGGEGDGWKTINPYAWQLNTWYNIVNRAWKLGGRLYVGTFINNTSTGKWFHSATLSMPDPGKYLGENNDAFLENWNGGDKSYNGSFIRKAFFKDCWNMNINGTWEKNTTAGFSANDSQADIKRNGIYHNSFNAYYDILEDAYCMQHGGNTTPSAAFNGARTIMLPAQNNQGNIPTLSVAKIISVNASYKKGKVNVNWQVDEFKSPQLTIKIEILDTSGKIIEMQESTIPEMRNCAIHSNLSNGNYDARLTVTDIFDQKSQPMSVSFAVSNYY